MKRHLAPLAAALVLSSLTLPSMAAAAPPPGVPMDQTFVFMGSMSSDAFKAQAYIETPKAKPVDGKITLWTATAAPADTPVGGHLGFFMLLRMGFDCDKRLHRWEGGVILDAADQVIGKDGVDDWEAVEPKSVNDKALQMACGETAPPAETLNGVAAVRADAARRYAE